MLGGGVDDVGGGQLGLVATVVHGNTNQGAPTAQLYSSDGVDALLIGVTGASGGGINMMFP